MSKICNNCKRSVDDAAKFCPYCKGESFEKKNEIAVPNSNLVHKIFYWDYNGRFVLSKTKITSIIILLIFTVLALASGAPRAVVFFALFFAGIVYLFGFALHKIIGPPSYAKLTHNDYGLAADLKNFFFFWQNKKGQYVLSKTKIISHIVFILFFIYALAGANPALNPFSALLVGLFFEIPTFAIGYAVHRLTNSDPQLKIEHKKAPKPKITPKPQVQIRQRKIVPEYMEYTRQIDDLNSKFIKKEKSTRELIAKRFEPPQLTYTRFITGVDKSSQLFKKHRDSAFTMINLADEYSARIASEIEAKIDILKEILDKLDSLSNELIVTDSITTKEDVDDLIGEMDNLIKSVREYE